VADLRELLRELATARGPVQRMKLLTRAWRTLRYLSPAERREIAARLGVKGFEEILDKIGVKKEEIVPEEVLEVLDKVEELEPSEVSRLIEDMRDPERRKRLVSRGLGAMRDQLLRKEEPAAPPTPSPEPVTQAASPEPAVPTAPAPKPERSAARRREAVKPAVAASPLVAPVAARPPEAAPVPRPEPVPAPAPGMPERRPSTTRAGSGGPGDSGLASELESADSLLARFRILREGLASGRPPVDPEVGAVLAVFPPGWARRRALAALLSAGVPADNDEAIRLIADLETRSSRRWCASLLAHSRDLDEADRGRLDEMC